VTTSWILFFSYQDDARSNTHQICTELNSVTCDYYTSEVFLCSRKTL